eukprot:7344842-Lingulodinium_polyedra.AAC.1
MAAQSSAHNWDVPVHPWDGDAHSSGEERGGEYTEEEEDAPATPGRKFAEEPRDLYTTRVLNARQTCQLFHLAAEAGIREAQAYGMPPGASS